MDWNEMPRKEVLKFAFLVLVIVAVIYGLPLLCLCLKETP